MTSKKSTKINELKETKKKFPSWFKPYREPEKPYLRSAPEKYHTKTRSERKNLGPEINGYYDLKHLPEEVIQRILDNPKSIIKFEIEIESDYSECSIQFFVHEEEKEQILNSEYEKEKLKFDKDKEKYKKELEEWKIRSEEWKKLKIEWDKEFLKKQISNAQRKLKKLEKT